MRQRRIKGENGSRLILWFSPTLLFVEKDPIMIHNCLNAKYLEPGKALHSYILEAYR